MNSALKYGDAWSQCYAYFGLADCKFDEEIACLRLAYYLAQFGMFRASGKLRTLELDHYLPLVLASRSHKNLRDKLPEQLAEMLCEVESFVGELEALLSKSGVTPTATLISKIALGTTACVPAYDRFVTAALSNLKIEAGLSNGGLESLFAHCRDALRKLGATETTGMPFMRALDIGLLNHGKALSHRRGQAGRIRRPSKVSAS